MKVIISILTLIGLLFITCKKEETSSLAPSIELVSMLPNIVNEYSDSIVFIIHYEDKDGDIGIPNADENSLFVKDARLNEADEYFIAPLAPLDESIWISGDFRIVLKNTFKLGNAPLEKTKYTIWLKDRAGNLSNTITSPELTINE